MFESHHQLQNLKRGGFPFSHLPGGMIRKLPLKGQYPIRSTRRSRSFVQSHITSSSKNPDLSLDKSGFLNDVCLRQMMLALPMMTASPNDACLAAHDGKHRIIANEMSNIIMHSITSYRQRRYIILPYSEENKLMLEKINFPLLKNLNFP